MASSKITAAGGARISAARASERPAFSSMNVLLPRVERADHEQRAVSTGDDDLRLRASTDRCVTLNRSGTSLVEFDPASRPSARVCREQHEPAITIVDEALDFA